MQNWTALMEDCMLAVDGTIIQRIKHELGLLISVTQMLDIDQNLYRCRSQSALIARKCMDSYHVNVTIFRTYA